MSKMKKFIITLLLATVTAFGVAGCNAGANELQDKVDDLQNQLEEINGKLSEMERLEAELAEMNDRLAETEKQIEQLEKELAEQSPGTFYSLQTAYDNGWLTQADVMSIAYYHNGGRVNNEEIMNEDYAPAPKTPEVLSSLTELKIKNAAAKEYREKYDIKEAKAEGFTITDYYGTYGACIAVSTEDIYSGAAAVVWVENIAGVYIWQSAGRETLIWRDTK